MKLFSRLNQTFFIFFFLGISLRLLTSLLVTENYDFLNIVAMVKSVADTGNLADGFFKLGHVQLYGKIYYQVAALWFLLLNHVHILSSEYLKVIGILPPQIYQIAAIKIVQFVYDFLQLFFLVKIAMLLNFKNKNAIVLFWALNPIAIFTGFALFQSDLAMVTFLLGSVYFAIKAIKFRHEKYSFLNMCLSLILLSIGAIIKQVPLIILPFLFMAFSPSMLQTIGLAFVFALSYFMLYQPWSIDAVLMKKYFLTSPESLALFSFGLNLFNVFFTFYLILFGWIFIIRKKIQENPVYLLHIVTLIVAIMYIAEDSGGLFVQFNLWIMPFLALLTLYDRNYAIFLIAPLIGFYHRALVDNGVLIGSLSIAFGQPLLTVQKYEKYISQFANIDLLLRFMNTILALFYSLLIIYIVLEISKNIRLHIIERITTYFKINLLKISLFIFAIYVLIMGADFGLRSQHALLTNYKYGNSLETPLSTKPVIVDIENKEQQKIHGIQLRIMNKGLSTVGFVVIKAIDKDTGEVLSQTKTFDALLPVTDDDPFYAFTFPKTITEKNIEFAISKENTTNSDVIFFSQTNDKDVPDYFSTRYDSYYIKNSIVINPTANNMYLRINALGEYSMLDALSNLKTQLISKPNVSLVYFITLGFFIFSTVLLTILSLRKNYFRKAIHL